MRIKEPMCAIRTFSHRDWRTLSHQQSHFAVVVVVAAAAAAAVFRKGRGRQRGRERISSRLHAQQGARHG